MKSAMNLVMTVLLLAIYACNKDIEDQTNGSTNHNDDPEVEVLWKIPLLPDTAECSVMDPVLMDNKLLFGGSVNFGSAGRVAIFKIESNELIWESDCEIKTTQVATVHFDNIFVGQCSSIITAFDLNNGNIIWTSPLNGGSKITNYGNKIFSTHFTGTNPFYSGSIVMADMNEGIWDTLFSIEMTDGFSVGLYPPSVMLNADQDTILCFQNRQWNFSESVGKIDLYAYNITADSLLWVENDIDPDGNSSVQSPVIYDNKVYFRGSRILFCFDAFTGEKLWERDLGIDLFEDLLNSNTLVVEGMLIVKTGGFYIYAFDPDTGNTIWSNDEAGATPSDMIYYNGNLYYGSAGDGMVHVIDVFSGETIKEFESPGEHDPQTPFAGFYDAVAIDPVMNYLFAGDGYYMYCIRINW